MLTFPLEAIFTIASRQWKVHHITLFLARFAANMSAILLFIHFNVSFLFLLLGQEITAELGSMSESSDDEFVTSRIVRRRFIMQVSVVEAATLIQHDFRLLTAFPPLKGWNKRCVFAGSLGGEKRPLNCTWLNLVVAYLTFLTSENASLLHLS